MRPADVTLSGRFAAHRVLRERKPLASGEKDDQDGNLR
jgi:hypothetical protein